MRIRPTREEAENSPTHFYELLEDRRESTDLTLSVIARIIGDTTANPEVNTHKRLKAQSLNSTAKSYILRHMFDTANLITGRIRRQLAAAPHALFFSLLNFFCVKETSQDKSRAKILGTYRLWRHSVEHRGECVFGRIEFVEDGASGALVANMLQVERSIDGGTVRREELTGYLFRVSHMHAMVLRDTKSNDIRVTLFTHGREDDVGTDVAPNSVFAGKRRHYTHLDGYCLGVDGGRAFFSPVHIQLEDDCERLQTLDDELDIVGPGHRNLPTRVAGRLQNAGPVLLL